MKKTKGFFQNYDKFLTVWIFAAAEKAIVRLFRVAKALEVSPPVLSTSELESAIRAEEDLRGYSWEFYFLR